MKSINKTLLCILALIMAFYLSFIFVLPNIIDLNNYSSQITSILEKQTGLKISAKGLKIKTTWKLDTGITIEKTNLKYPNNQKFGQINNLQINLSLLPLFYKQIKIDKIIMDKILINADIDSNGNFVLEKILNKNTKPQKNDFLWSEKQPDIYAKYYRISFENNLQKYVIKGSNFKISDFYKDKKIKAEAAGSLFINHKQYITYNVSIYDKNFAKNTSTKNNNLNVIKILNEISKYKIKANIIANLHIYNDKINGKLDIDKISFKLGGKTFPQNSLKIEFNKNKAKINSSIHTSESSKTIITGLYKSGKNRLLDLHVKSDNTEIKDICTVSKTILKPLYKSEFQNIEASGLLNADFDITSNFKKFTSRGFLNIKNGQISDKKYKVLLSAINADVDFSQDTMIIKKATAKLNNQPIIIKGAINKNAYANINVKANNLPLRSLILTLGRTDILRENQILGGNVSLNALLKGNLNTVKPRVDINSDNIYIINNTNKTKIRLSKAAITIQTNLKSNNELKGFSKLENIKIQNKTNQTISLSKLNLNFDRNTLTIPETNILIANIKTKISGEISNLTTKPIIKKIQLIIPKQYNIPIKGYANSNVSIEGTLDITGQINNPKMFGNINLPVVKLPSIHTYLSNIEIALDNQNIYLKAPKVQMADTTLSANGILSKDISKGIVIKNLSFDSNYFDMNDILPILKTLPKGSNGNFNILDGTNSLQIFKMGRIITSNVNSRIKLKNNILYLNNLTANAYSGKIAGDISYDITRKKTTLNLQGRGLSSNPAIIAITGRDDDILGKLDFDTNISFYGYSKREIERSLKGFLNFIISNGKMGVLGKFEHLLYAQNIISNNIFRANLNAAVKMLTVKNTGVYKYMKGKMTFGNSCAYITWIKTSGPSMSLFMTGRYYIPDNNADLTILGRISNDVVSILGPIGESSMDKVISYIPKVGEITSYLSSQFRTNVNYENTREIPPLTPKTEFQTREFKVIIDGDIQKQTSVKSFKWITKQSQVIPQYKETYPQKKNTQSIPEFINKLPELK